MTGREVYNTALSHLGYTDNPTTQRRATLILNKVYYDLHRIIYGAEEFVPIKSLSDSIDLPQKVIISAMVSGVAESLALGEGDGELQQYFALDYDRGKAKLNTNDKIHDVMP